MRFSEAMKALEDGKEVRCTRWPSKDKCSHGNLYTALVSHESIDYALEWEIYEEPEKTYTFMEVVKGLKEGKKYTLPRWAKDTYIYWDPIYLELYSFERGLLSSFCFRCLDSFESTDWVEVKC